MDSSYLCTRKAKTTEDMETYAMIDQSERDIAEGRVYDFDEAMDELEKEFAAEDRQARRVYEGSATDAPAH